MAYFVPNFPGQRQLWKLKFFCTWGSGPEGKECVANVKKLPASARWFTDFAQVFLEPDAEIVRSWEHFAYDNMCRIPLHVLRDCSRFSHEVEAMLDSYPINSTDDETKKFIEEFKRKLEETGYQDRFDFNLRAKFEYAINLAMKKVRWNFNCAVPMFFPSRRTFSFLLPLSLDDPSIVDVALVVDRVKDATNSIYQAQTILTLSMAYTNARLLRRPDASWLCCLTNGHGRVQPDMSPANEMSRDGISHSSKAADEFSDKEKNVGVIGNKAQAVSSIDDCSRDGDCAAESGESVSGDYTSPDAVERLRSKLKYLD